MEFSALPDDFYRQLAQDALAGKSLDDDQALTILTSPYVELLPLLQAAFRVRSHYFGRGVQMQILNNVQNGHCSEDCNYCAQAVNSTAAIQEYRMKDEEAILAEARQAHLSGAYRYCLVLSGRAPSDKRLHHLTHIVQRLKADFPMEVCLSAGLIDQQMAEALKKVGLDRYNHNLNTSESHYGGICTTHTYQDRVATLQAARNAGLEVCSGLIIGLGEEPWEVVTVAKELKRLGARSVPVNFYVHIEGSRLVPPPPLTPEQCLRTLCLFRFLLPDTEIRAAGGREKNLRSLEALALYPANSLFAEGYLNTSGNSSAQTVRMIIDAGFHVLEK
ncbi:MAG: biotin synthase BioB [Magnetococcus sp. DMHC-6]